MANLTNTAGLAIGPGPLGVGGGLGAFVLYDSNSPGTIGPLVINAFTTLSIPAYWRAVNFAADTLASLPRKVDGDDKHYVNSLLRRRPNKYQSSFKFWQTLFFHRHHYGNGYARIERQGSKIIGLHILRPEYIIPLIYENERYYLVTAGEQEILHGSDVIHLMGLSFDGLQGFNPVYVLSDAFERARTTDAYITRILRKGTLIKGSITLPAETDPDKLAQIMARLRSNFTGPNAESDIIVLADGATMQNQTISPEQTQLVQQTQYGTKQIAQITGVPPAHLFEFSEAKYNPAAVEAQSIALIRDCLRPLIEAAEDELNNKLLTDEEFSRGLSIKIDPAAII